jgi:hypothetical protein
MTTGSLTSDAARIRAARKAAIRLMDAWSCTPEQAASLLSMDVDAWEAFKEGKLDEAFTAEQLERLSYLVRVYNGLSVFSDDTAHAWPRLKNNGPLFQGRSPVDIMIEGGDVAMSNVAKMTESLGW